MFVTIFLCILSITLVCPFDVYHLVLILSPHRFVTIRALRMYILRTCIVYFLLSCNKGYKSLDLSISSFENCPRLKLYFFSLAIGKPIFFLWYSYLPNYVHHSVSNPLIDECLITRGDCVLYLFTP